MANPRHDLQRNRRNRRRAAIVAKRKIRRAELRMRNAIPDGYDAAGNYTGRTTTSSRWIDCGAHVEAWKKSAAYRKRPFRFEDLNGLPEPPRWGPLYPTLPGVEKWRKVEKARELTDAETCAYGAAVGKAIRDLQRRELCGAIRPEPSLKCTVQNTVRGTDNTAKGEAERYQAWRDRLIVLRAKRAEAKVRAEEAKARALEVWLKAA